MYFLRSLEGLQELSAGLGALVNPYRDAVIQEQPPRELQAGDSVIIKRSGTPGVVWGIGFNGVYWVRVDLPDGAWNTTPCWREELVLYDPVNFT